MVACLSTHEAIILHDGEKELGCIPLGGVVDVSLLDDSSVRRRPITDRFLLLGPLAFLFMKTTIREVYRLCTQWKDPEGGYHFTYVRIATRIMAARMLNAVKRSLTPEVCTALAQKALEAKERAAVSDKEQHHRVISTAPPRPRRLSPAVLLTPCIISLDKQKQPPYTSTHRKQHLIKYQTNIKSIESNTLSKWFKKWLTKIQLSKLPE
jgi:hypothetical protein